MKRSQLYLALTRQHPKRGDRVIMLQCRHYRCYWHRKLPIYGKVLYRRNGCVYVRPAWANKRDIHECYDTEVLVVPTKVKLPAWVTQRPRKAIGSL